MNANTTVGKLFISLSAVKFSVCPTGLTQQEADSNVYGQRCNVKKGALCKVMPSTPTRNPTPIRGRIGCVRIDDCGIRIRSVRKLIVSDWKFLCRFRIGFGLDLDGVGSDWPSRSNPTLGFSVNVRKGALCSAGFYRTLSAGPSESILVVWEKLLQRRLSHPKVATSFMKTELHSYILC